MSDLVEKPNIIDFIAEAKKKYYGPECRELSNKRQLHLMDVIIHDDDLKKKELTNGSSSDTY